MEKVCTESVGESSVLQHCKLPFDDKLNGCHVLSTSVTFNLHFSNVFDDKFFGINLSSFSEVFSILLHVCTSPHAVILLGWTGLAQLKAANRPLVITDSNEDIQTLFWPAILDAASRLSI